MNEADPLFARLEVLIDEQPHRGSYNMALDEVLLCTPLEMPLLRLYRWALPTVSFGYFEPWRPVAVQFRSQELVRRWTGGGVVDHQHDWSYSLLLPRSERMTNLPAGESYRLIHMKLRCALTDAGFKGVVLHGNTDVARNTNSRSCFVKAVPYDLLMDGRKISGAAQRRTCQGLLHQGSVQNIPRGSVSLDHLTDLLPSVLARQTWIRKLSLEVEAAALRLADAKYAIDTWLHRV